MTCEVEVRPAFSKPSSDGVSVSRSRTTFWCSSSERATSRSREPRTSVVVLRSRSCGVQEKLERDRRKRSVEVMTTLSPSNWMRTPVSTGRFSSRETATLAWDTACTKVGASTWPILAGTIGRSGYSVSGMSCSVKVDLPELMVSVEASVDR